MKHPNLALPFKRYTNPLKGVKRCVSLMNACLWAVLSTACRTLCCIHALSCQSKGAFFCTALIFSTQARSHDAHFQQSLVLTSQEQTPGKALPDQNPPFAALRVTAKLRGPFGEIQESKATLFSSQSITQSLAQKPSAYPSSGNMKLGQVSELYVEIKDNSKYDLTVSLRAQLISKDSNKANNASRKNPAQIYQIRRGTKLHTLLPIGPLNRHNQGAESTKITPRTETQNSQHLVEVILEFGSLLQCSERSEHSESKSNDPTSEMLSPKQRKLKEPLKLKPRPWQREPINLKKTASTIHLFKDSPSNLQRLKN